jgi:hypothetical protein
MTTFEAVVSGMVFSSADLAIIKLVFDGQHSGTLCGNIDVYVNSRGLPLLASTHGGQGYENCLLKKGKACK